VLALFFQRVSDKKNCAGADETNRTPAPFSIDHAILFDECKLIQENRPCQLKTDAMFADIALSFRLVPFKQDHAESIVMPIM